MPKIEITASDDFSREAYEQALDRAKKRLDVLEAERDKAVAEAKQLVDKLREINNENAELRTKNDILRMANSEYQQELIRIKAELTKANDALAKTDDYREYFGEEDDTGSDEEPCNGDCANCDHAISDDTEVDEQIDYLIRENLDLEGQKKGLLDALHLLCGWLRWSNGVEESK